MKKKSIHKVSSTKKITPKPLKKKKSFSLRSWLLGSLVLIAALSYSLYQYNLQPKGIKVLEIPGTAFDYLVPSKATIYKIIEVDPGNAKNDLEAKVIDQLNKSANKVERLDKSNNNKQKEESLKELLEIGTAHKILNTYTDNNLSSVLDKDNNPTPEQQYEKLIKESKMKLAGNYYYENPLSFSNTNVNNNPASIAQGGQTVIGDGKGCGTSAFTVGSGETVIGAADKIYSCDNGIWSPVYLSDGITQCTKNDTDPLCRISVLPIYAGGKNCYNDGGATVLGDGSIQENGDGTASLCDGGKMVNNLVYYDGKWVTEDEKKIAEDKKKADEAAKKAQLAYNEKVCKKNGANWDGEVCRSSSESCASIGKDFDGKNCVDKKLTTKPDNKVVNPNGSKTGGELTTSVKDCIYGGTPTGRGDSRSAEFRCNDSTGKVPETKEECRAQGTVVVCKVYDLSGKYLSEYRKTGETIKKEVNSNGIYQNGEVTYNESDCIYGGEPTGIGSSQGAQFKCKDSTGVVPRTSLTQVDFGANDQSLLADAPGNFNYDTKGGLAGFVAGYNLSGIPCSVYYLGGVFGIPSNFACRIKGGFAGALAGNKLGDYIYNISNQNNAQNSNTSNSTSPVNTADVIMPKLKGEVELGSECNVSSDCQSGYCAPPVLNFLPQRCESPNKHFSKQVSDGGKYLEGITCKDNNQCEEGLYCMQRFIGSNTCESKTNITLKSGDKCPLTLTFGEEQSCAHCPDGYGVSEGKSYCK